MEFNDQKNIINAENMGSPCVVNIPYICWYNRPGNSLDCVAHLIRASLFAGVNGKEDAQLNAELKVLLFICGFSFVCAVLK